MLCTSKMSCNPDWYVEEVNQQKTAVTQCKYYSFKHGHLSRPKNKIYKQNRMWLFLSNCSCKILLFITNFIYTVAQDPKQMWKNDNGFFLKNFSTCREVQYTACK